MVKLRSQEKQKIDRRFEIESVIKARKKQQKDLDGKIQVIENQIIDHERMVTECKSQIGEKKNECKKSGENIGKTSKSRSCTESSIKQIRR